MSDLGDSNARKRLRRSKDSTDSMDNIEQYAPTSAAVDEKLFDVYFPKHLESTFAAAIFELGLKHSSPKILMVRFDLYGIFLFLFSPHKIVFALPSQPLMPNETNLSTEHIKSHLQKYRIHRQRSKDEFFDFYNNYMKDTFQQWENAEGWKSTQNGSSSSGALDNSSDNGLAHLANAEGALGVFGDERTEREDAPANIFSAALDAKVEYATSRYAKEILQETESLLMNLQSLCQEVVESGDTLKRKPEVQRSSSRLI